MRKLLALSAAAIVSAGCPERDPLGKPIERPDFVMGVQGEGKIVFKAVGPQNGVQSGECAQAQCRATVDDLTQLILTPVPGARSKFKLWVGAPADNLFCPGAPGADGVLQVTVSRASACIAIFEPIGDASGTVPGAR